MHENFKKLQAYIDFSTKILLNSLASRAPSLNPIEMNISKLPKFSRKIRGNFKNV